MSAVTTGATDASPTTRYAHNALGPRVFKTEPLYPPVQGDEASAGFMQSLIDFFAQLWQPATSDAEKLGTGYVYDENGSLIYEAGTGGANSTGTTRYIYLPTANGPMPIMAVVNGRRFAVSSDHLNTPRRITNDQGQVVWQWAYSAFGETKPTQAKNRFADPEVTPNAGTTNIAALDYNLGYQGMYRDNESGLFYNYFRSYKPDLGYMQNDPIGLLGGFNRKTPLENNPLMYTDPFGLVNQEAQRQLNKWFGPQTPSKNCVTAECAAGLTPTPSENRNQREIDYGQCKLVCQISLAVPYAACNAVLGGRVAGTVGGMLAKGGACSWVCK